MLKLSFGIGSRVRVQAGVRIRALGLDLGSALGFGLMLVV